MHRDPRRLIDHQHGFVFIDDRQFGLDFRAGDDFFNALRDPETGGRRKTSPN